MDGDAAEPFEVFLAACGCSVALMTKLRLSRATVLPANGKAAFRPSLTRAVASPVCIHARFDGSICESVQDKELRPLPYSN